MCAAPGRSLRAALTAAAVLLCGCGSLVGTRVEVTGAQRALEEQVLGAFRQMGREVYLLAGVRSVDPMTGAPKAPPPMTASQARALRARRRMEYNRDDVLQFERLGCVGEGNDGLLVVFEDQLARLQSEKPGTARLVRAIVAEENEDRRVTMQRIVDITPELRGEEGLASVGRILAQQRREQAEPGTKVQLPGGEWKTVEGAQ